MERRVQKEKQNEGAVSRALMIMVERKKLRSGRAIRWAGFRFGGPGVVNGRDGGVTRYAKLKLGGMREIGDVDNIADIELAHVDIEVSREVCGERVNFNGI